MDAHLNREIIYRIDETNCITYLSPGWFNFAAKNGAADLKADQIIGRPLLSFISGNSTRQLFSLILDHVRRSHWSLEFPFRCDSPTLRRFMEITITPLDQFHLEFRCCTIKEELRSRAPLFEKEEPPTEPLLRMCSWCKKVAIPSGKWVEVEEAVRELHLFEHQPFPQVTHGICMNCELQVRAKLKTSSPKH